MNADDVALRARSFGAAAELYDRARPSYPAALVDELLAFSPQAVLDVGCGTGKAAELFIARGVRLLAVEPDSRMAEVARRKGIDVEVSSFETWDPRGRGFDLVIAGQSWHWVQQPAGAVKAHAVLRAGGHLAAFWNLGAHEPAAEAALEAIYRELAPEIADTTTAIRQTAHADERRGHLEALAAAGFQPIEARSYEWTHEYSRAAWLDYLGTHSDHLTLPEDRRRRLLQRVGDVVDALGGTVVFRYRTVMLLATR